MDNLSETDVNKKQLVLISFENIILGFPQSNIIFVENLSQVNENSLTVNSSGQLEYEGDIIAVYSFSNNLEFLPDLSANNKICVIFKQTNNLQFLLLCVSQLKKSQSITLVL